LEKYQLLSLVVIAQARLKAFANWLWLLLLVEIVSGFVNGSDSMIFLIALCQIEKEEQLLSLL
jgi:hypothetical protein